MIRDQNCTLLFYISLGFSFVIFVFSLATNLGGSSLFLDPIAAFLTIVHHVTIILLPRWRARRSTYHSMDPPSLPYIHSLGCIICAWLLGLLWSVGAVLLAVDTVFYFLDDYTVGRDVVAIIELLLAFMEGVLVFTIAVLCTRGRTNERTNDPGPVQNIS